MIVGTKLLVVEIILMIKSTKVCGDQMGIKDFGRILVRVIGLERQKIMF